MASVAFIGGGTMARAIVRGGMAAGVLDGRLVAVAEPDGARRAEFEGVVGLASASGAEALRWLSEHEATPDAGQVVLAVKPQSLAEVAREVGPLLAAGPERVVVTILAGTPSAKVRAALGGRARIVRVMPNTPAQIGMGMTAIAPGEGARPGDGAAARRLFGAIGKVIDLDEPLMDAFTAVAGSGPAYLFYLAEAMVEGAVRAGFDRGTALAVVRQTLAGAGALLAQSGDEPAALRAAVTSKGGTTAAATGVLDAAGVMEAVARAVVAAKDRGREMARG